PGRRPSGPPPPRGPRTGWTLRLAAAVASAGAASAVPTASASAAVPVAPGRALGTGVLAALLVLGRLLARLGAALVVFAARLLAGLVGRLLAGFLRGVLAGLLRGFGGVGGRRRRGRGHVAALAGLVVERHLLGEVEELLALERGRHDVPPDVGGERAAGDVPD